MKKRRHVLGLHTPAEQTHALTLIRDAAREGRTAVEFNDALTAAFALGQLAAIRDLAEAEGAKVLAQDAQRLFLDLRQEFQAIN